MSSTTTQTTDAQVPIKGTNGTSQYDFKNLTPYVHPPETKDDLPWSDLVTLDLEDFDRPGGKERLTKQLEHAVHHVGFFYVKNFGLTQEQTDRQFTLAKHFFELPTEEKEKYTVNALAADYNGYKTGPKKTEVDAARAFSNVEIFNFPKFTPDFVGKYRYPDLLNAHLAEIEHFQRKLHSNVILPLLVLIARVLELPDEQYLAKQHSFERKSEDHFRYMIYNPLTEEEWAERDYGRKGGHTDLGTLTLLFRQPVVGLQILGENDEWTYVRPLPGTITVNLADTISHLTGGWLKSSVHRVVAPPQDQREFKRTGLLYFSRPHNDTLLEPLDSPVLRAAGAKSRFEKPVTVEEWVRAKQTLQLNPSIAHKKWLESKDGTVELLAGFKDRKYKE